MRKWTEESKKLFSETQKKRFKIASNNPMFGKTHTEETKLKMSLANKGKKSKFKGLTKKNNPDLIKNGLQKEKHPFWKGGITIYRKLINIESCLKCHKTKTLIVHHQDENRNNNDINNLIVLCRSCHALEHNAGNHLKKLIHNRNNKGQYIN